MSKFKFTAQSTSAEQAVARQIQPSAPAPAPPPRAASGGVGSGVGQAEQATRRPFVLKSTSLREEEEARRLSSAGPSGGQSARKFELKSRQATAHPPRPAQPPLAAGPAQLTQPAQPSQHVRPAPLDHSMPGKQAAPVPRDPSVFRPAGGPKAMVAPVAEDEFDLMLENDQFVEAEDLAGTCTYSYAQLATNFSR